MTDEDHPQQPPEPLMGRYVIRRLLQMIPVCVRHGRGGWVLVVNVARQTPSRASAATRQCDP
ncbi:hypothetical protein SMICM17S_10917 [Streptomyces microflavus]